MRAALFKGPYDIDIVDYSLPVLKPDEVLLKVEVCGICGTDFHIYNGESYSKPPLIPGHEFTGIIVDKGKNVTEFQLDDHVVIDPNIYCGYCNFCRNGQINFCSNLKALGVSLNGGFAEYSIVPVSQVYKIPLDFSFHAAAFAEPLSCCVRGIDRADIKAGESVVIIGSGTIGLLMLQLAKISGAARVLVIEPNEFKRTLAMQMGANYALDSGSDEIHHQIKDYTSGGPDIVIECAGNSNAVKMAMDISRRGGRVIIFGLAEKNDTINLNLQDFFLKELSIKGSLLNPFTFSRSVDLLVTNKVQVENLHPVTSPLENLKKILSLPRNLEITKYQITPNL